MGVLLMIAFLLELNRRGMFSNRSALLKATSCRAVLQMLDKRVPATWSTSCEGNNIAIEIQKSLQGAQKMELVLLKRILYRELANHLTFISRNSPNETLERVKFIRIKLIHAKMDITALTQGQHVAQMATLGDPKFIAEHLKATVNVTEKIK